MVEVTTEARQRCADLSNEIAVEQGYNQCWDAEDFTDDDVADRAAFAHHVQQASDTARKLVRLIDETVPKDLVQRDMLRKMHDLARSLMLPEPVDPLVDAFANAQGGFGTMDYAGNAQRLRAYLAKQGKRIEIVENK